MLAVSLIVIAMARPQSPLPDSRIETEGVDIVLALDSSTSMLARDYKVAGLSQSRSDVIKNVVEEFIKARRNDRIAIISFAARAYTVCPLTLDYSWLIENLGRVKPGVIEDGTAIGSGITCALNRVKDTKAKSKIMILLTDGGNNAGNISPLTAAEAAKALKIKIYTIGAGSKGLVSYPVHDQAGNLLGYQQVQSDLDEDLLQKIAATTGGKYYRAADTDSLRNVYKEIDSLEKSPIQDKGSQEYNELFGLFLLPGLLLLILEIILNQTILRRIP
jgi:Ca-activated chloride channel family protein